MQESRKERAGIRIVGLTGGIATGKTTVASFLAKKGAAVIDADQLARAVVEPGAPALAEITALFGDETLLPDGSLDRKKMRLLVFGNDTKRRQLESILHPKIRRLAKARIKEAISDGRKIVVYMAPLLIEAEATDLVDEIWVVTLSPEVQLRRLMERDGLSAKEARKIIDSQMPLAEKERYGRVIIDNSGDPELTLEALEEIWSREMSNDVE